MNIGGVSYLNYPASNGRVQLPSSSSGYNNTRIDIPSQNVMPEGSFALPSQGPYALFLSPDGDRAEISLGVLEASKPQGPCVTCENRRYVDQSDDASVSYQTPTKLNSSTAGAAVAAHENEHVRNEKARAHRDGREIVNQTVTLTYDSCPECGKHYVSGGTTRTTSISKQDSDDDTAYEAPFTEEEDDNQA